MKKPITTLLAACLVVMFTMGSAAASDWCGENGLVRLSFTEGDELQPVKTVETDGKGVVTVDLYAYLTDMDPVKKNGEAFLGIAAVEFTLVIEGAEGFITSQEFAMINRTVGRRPGEVMVGFDPGLPVNDGQTQVVHWEILFQGNPKNVVFSLDPDALLSCTRTEGCSEGRPYALYTGNDACKQLGSIFGAGYVPAYLNYEGEPDLTPLRANQTWRDVGLYDAR